MMKRMTPYFLAVVFLVLGVACGDVGHDDHSGHDHHGHDHHANEVFTTVTLTFTPVSGGEAIVASWADPEADGSPVIDPINLTNDETYAVSVTFFNELEDPAEEMTPEVLDEDDEHQVFFTGSAVAGAASASADAIVEQAYDDADGNGFPLGLSNTFQAVAAGTGTMTVTLRHMPTVNGVTVKTATLAADVIADGITALPGSTDINVDFEVTVQ